jgi:hypothetical protein
MALKEQRDAASNTPCACTRKPQRSNFIKMSHGFAFLSFPSCRNNLDYGGDSSSIMLDNDNDDNFGLPRDLGDGESGGNMSMDQSGSMNHSQIFEQSLSADHPAADDNNNMGDHDDDTDDDDDDDDDNNYDDDDIDDDDDYNADDYDDDNFYNNASEAEASFTLDEVMQQKSMANLDASVADAADVEEPTTWIGRMAQQLKRMWDDTEQEMHSMEDMANSSNQLSSSAAHESSRYMAGVAFSGKTQLYVTRLSLSLSLVHVMLSMFVFFLVY